MWTNKRSELSLYQRNVEQPVKVGTHKGTTSCDYFMQLDSQRVTQRDWMHMNSSHKLFWGTSRRDLKFPEIQTKESQVTKFEYPWLDFVAEMTSSLDETCPHDLLKGLVAWTSPLGCADIHCTCKQQSMLNARDWKGTGPQIFIVLGLFSRFILAAKDHYSSHTSLRHAIVLSS